MKAAVMLVCLAALTAAFAGAGKWEAQRQLDSQLHGLQRVRSAVGRLDSSSLETYRTSPDFHCLDYRRATLPDALELCFDNRYRLVQASDRRGTEPKVYSLRLAPDAAAPELPHRQAARAFSMAQHQALKSVAATVDLFLSTCAIGPPRRTNALALAACRSGQTALASEASLVASVGVPRLERLSTAARSLVDAYTAVRSRPDLTPKELNSRLAVLAVRAKSVQLRLARLAEASRHPASIAP
jgi:hypothetical protein